MRYYFAPMEGFTTWVFRKLHRQYFPGIGRYFTPFVSANQTFAFNPKEERDLCPEHNDLTRTVPQVLAKNAEQFVWAVSEIGGMGYSEVNLNLGCPSSTVTAKGKGAGLIRDREVLNAFLEETFDRIAKGQGEGIPGSSGSRTPVISVKTRIGYESEDEFDELIRIFNRYPISEVTVHPRLRTEFYKGTVHREIFLQKYREIRHPVVYNGDIRTVEDLRSIEEAAPDIPAVMIGRGLIADPAMVRQAEGGEPLRRDELYDFQKNLFEEHAEAMQSERNALFKMKEFWPYFARNFEENPRGLKRIVKAKNAAEYRSEVDRFFHGTAFRPQDQDHTGSVQKGIKDGKVS